MSLENQAGQKRGRPRSHDRDGKRKAVVHRMWREGTVQVQDMRGHLPRPRAGFAVGEQAKGYSGKNCLLAQQVCEAVAKRALDLCLFGCKKLTCEPQWAMVLMGDPTQLQTGHPHRDCHQSA